MKNLTLTQKRDIHAKAMVEKRKSFKAFMSDKTAENLVMYKQARKVMDKAYEAVMNH